MRRVALIATFAALLATAGSAQKVMVPAQSANGNVRITPAPPVDHDLEKARRVARDEAIKLVKENKAVFVDVRSKEAYEAGHIKGAMNIPESQLVTRMRELPIKRMVITYCA